MVIGRAWSLSASRFGSQINFRQLNTQMSAIMLRQSKFTGYKPLAFEHAQVETFGTPANDMMAHSTPITPAPAINPEAVVSLNRSQCSGFRNSQILAAIAPLNMTHDCSGKMMNARPILVPLGTYLPTNRLRVAECIAVTAGVDARSQVSPATATA